ncbi:cytochrome P450, partial [Streptomyces calidiresistens]
MLLASHPLLLALLTLGRRAPVRRIGGTVIVHGTDACREALTRLTLDRTGEGTTGSITRELVGSGTLFDASGGEHRAGRRSLADRLGTAGVERTRPLRREVLRRRLEPLAHGAEVDVADLARELAGVSAAALVDHPGDPRELADAALGAAADAVRAHLPAPWPPARRRAAERARRSADRLAALLREAADPGPAPDAALRATVVTAAVATTVSLLPRAVARCADARLWAWADDPGHRAVLTDEALRVVAPSPVLPRRSAAPGTVAGRPVPAGARLLLVVRHGALAHRRDLDPADPAPPATARLVFGAGPHACPGAGLARAVLDELFAELAPHRPVVTRARGDRHAALPGWRSLVVRAGRGARA